MATSYSLGDMNPGDNQIDLIDVLALTIVPAMASFLFGVFTLQVNVFGGYDLVAPIWTFGGADISAAFLLTFFGVTWIGMTNIANSETQHTTEELAVFGTALAAPLLVVFVPAFENLVMWSGLTQIMFTLYVSVAAVIVSYTA